MRLSKFLARTLRGDPSEAEVPSHRLMLRAGMVHQVASGVYSYAPLAQRSLAKIQAIIRREMDAADGQEVRLAALQPLELWRQSGRDEAFGPDLIRLNDRRDRPMVMAPTHEEVVTLLVRQMVQSYRDLPLLLYQIQTKFRDEPRPLAGLIRDSEFYIKDAYSIDADEDALDVSYRRMAEAYQRIFSICGLPAVMVEADSGAIGGKDSQEFILPTPVGEDTFLQCPSCGYAANAERAEFARPDAPQEDPLPVEDVHTPGIKTIAELTEFLGVPPEKTLKAVFYVADGEPVFVTVRGDLEVNEIKLRRALGCHDLRLATDEEAAAAGLVAGSASNVGLEGMRTVADESVRVGANFVAGANRRDYHLLNVNCPRDFNPDQVADIALAQDGHACARCGTVLVAERGIELGHVFKVGTHFSNALGATFLDHEGHHQPMIMGCYGIGVGRLLAAAIEHNHDDRGMRLPPALAPFQVHLAALNVENPEVQAAADDLHAALEKAGVEVLYDDRNESAGVKLNDADLFGFPVRVVVSPRTLRDGEAEVKRRDAGEAARTPLADAVGTVVGMLAAWQPQ